MKNLDEKMGITPSRKSHRQTVWKKDYKISVAKLETCKIRIGAFHFNSVSI